MSRSCRCTRTLESRGRLRLEQGMHRFQCTHHRPRALRPPWPCKSARPRLRRRTPRPRRRTRNGLVLRQRRNCRIEPRCTLLSVPLPDTQEAPVPCIAKSRCCDTSRCCRRDTDNQAAWRLPPSGSCTCRQWSAWWRGTRHRSRCNASSMRRRRCRRCRRCRRWRARGTRSSTRRRRNSDRQASPVRTCGHSSAQRLDTNWLRQPRLLRSSHRLRPR